VDLTRSARGRTHDLTAAGTHRIIRICKRQGVPVLADRAYIGAGSWVTTPIRRLPHQDLNPTQRTINRALSAARAPVERSVARLKSWRIFRRSRCSPNRMSVIAAAVLTPERATLKTLTDHGQRHLLERRQAVGIHRHRRCLMPSMSACNST
jgi:hypothetical protein